MQTSLWIISLHHFPRQKKSLHYGGPGLPSASGKAPACQCRRHKRQVFNTWVVKIPLEEGTATHSSTLAWKIPWMEGPGGLQSMWSLRVGHDWVTSLSLFTFMHWRRKWQSTPVSLPGKSYGQRSLVGYSPQGCKESDTTWWLNNKKIDIYFSGMV